jgi:hypothetical protein
MHYLVKKGAMYYSNGAYIENVAGAPEGNGCSAPADREIPISSCCGKLCVYTCSQPTKMSVLTSFQRNISPRIQSRQV